VLEKMKVCPIQGRQLLDVRKEDIFEDFRVCNTYRGGGGYDMFPFIACKRGLLHNWSRGNSATQFVVQLYGCHLRCNYCYVTRDGVLGDYKEYSYRKLMEAFMRAYKEHNVGIFHLMGGAPAFYMDQWSHLIKLLHPYFIFHSDILLTEQLYTMDILRSIEYNNTLYAVNIKGVRDKDYEENTGRKMNWELFWTNLDMVVDSDINFYITFTNPDPDYINEFKTELVNRYNRRVLDESFTIELKQYDAIRYSKAW